MNSSRAFAPQSSKAKGTPFMGTDLEIALARFVALETTKICRISAASASTHTKYETPAPRPSGPDHSSTMVDSIPSECRNRAHWQWTVLAASTLLLVSLMVPWTLTVPVPVAGM
jgi:hypothetical protein